MTKKKSTLGIIEANGRVYEKVAHTWTFGIITKLN